MERERIIEELAKAGYEAQAIDPVKNDVKKAGISVVTGIAGINLSPIFYMDYLEENYPSEEEAAGFITRYIVSHKEEMEKEAENVKRLSDPGYILDNIYIGMQRASSQEGIIKRPSEFEGIEEYLYVRIQAPGRSEYGDVKIPEDMLTKAGISAAAAWEKALANVTAEAGIAPMPGPYGGTVFYILTNRQRNRGASSILAKEKIIDFAREHGYKMLYILPSSVDEVLLVPDEGGFQDIEILSKMVKEVNETELLPEERLADRAYIITF